MCHTHEVIEDGRHPTPVGMHGRPFIGPVETDSAFDGVSVYPVLEPRRHGMTCTTDAEHFMVGHGKTAVGFAIFNNPKQRSVFPCASGH